MAFICSVASGVVAEIVKYGIKPIVHQIGYLVFYNRNKKELKEQFEKLETTERDMQQRIEDARRNAYEISEKVSKWLVDVSNAKSVYDELFNSNPSCFNLYQRHQQSRKMKKKAADIHYLTLEGNKTLQVGYPAPLPDIVNTIVPEGYQVLKSKTSMAKQIKDVLAKPGVNKVGVHGMGGVGKTYLLNEVKKLVLEEKLFDRVINVTVGQSNDVVKMQQQIGDKLNKELPKSEEGRASFLRNMLDEMKGNTLVTLDDLWKEYDLVTEVGIPCSESSKERCKVLMTSRSENILASKMNVKECFEVTCLDKEESWEFFKKVVGYEFDTTDMENIAMKVAKECGGLPLALDIIAKTLKRKGKTHWDEALSNLKNSIPVNIKDVSEKVYASLRLSFDSLDGEEVKSLFLLCSVFPDDYNISIKDLQMCVMGMRLLKMGNTWKTTRNKVQNIVEDLKSSSLLQLEENYVKMHDIVREVAIFIGPEFRMSTLSYGYESYDWLDEDKCGSYRAIFINDKKFFNLLQNLSFPKLESLILRFSTQEYIEIFVEYFEAMENLKVLDLDMVHVPSLLWTSLKNLRMLCMSHCKCNGIDTVGHNLKKLEILKIHDCSDITELPATMSELTQLKVLIVADCFSLMVIRPNILSSMTKLEELDIQDSFEEWGEEVWYENTWIKNAQLSELNNLPRLSILRLEVSKADNILSKDLSSQTLKNLKEFFICIGTSKPIVIDDIISSSPKASKYEKIVSLDIKSQVGCSIHGKAVDILLEATEYLMIQNDLVDFANGNGYPLLKCLVIDRDSKMTHLSENGFTSLERLGLINMMLLESIVPTHSPTSNSLNKLKVIKIESCKKLKNLFPFSLLKALSNLQEIWVKDCDMLDEIISLEAEDKKTICTSPLTSLYLEDVNKLKSFCTKLPLNIQQNSQIVIPFFDQQVSFPELEKLSINGGNNVELLWHNNGSFGSSFSKLRSIDIRKCNKLRGCMFSSNIVASLIFLDTLCITDCELLEGIFEIEKPITFGDTKIVPLRVLFLLNLKNLKYVWSKNVCDDFVFPNLKDVTVIRCPELKNIFPASFTKYIEHIESLDVENEVFVGDETTKLGKVVLFERLKRLRMSCKEAANEMFWIISKFPKLQSLALVGCEEEEEEDDDKISIRLPMEMSEVLYNIEQLEIRSCLKLVQVFGINKNADMIQRCPNLESLTLRNLPKLTLGYLSATIFLNLVDIKVHGCNGMIYLFSSSVAKNLVNLNSIYISDCTGMTSIVSDEDEEEENGEIVFSKLTSLWFGELPRVACFHSGKCTLKFPILNSLRIWKCDDMKTFSHGITNTPNLESIEIGCERWDEFKVSLTLTQGINDIIQAFFRKEIEFLQGMKHVELSFKSMMRRIKFWDEQFAEIEDLTLICSEDDDIVCLPLEMSELLLYNLERFEIRNALQLTHVFETEDMISLSTANNNNVVQRCAKLKRLDLYDLPKLTHVWKESNEKVITTVSFDSLAYIIVRSCENLKCIFPSSLTFSNLDTLVVDGCHGMTKLFSSSMVKNLENLRSIRIHNCGEMRSIVEAEEEENGEIILFRKLECITLDNLSRLVSFHSGKCKLKFPSLERLHITGCKEMETFSGGIVTTPKLPSISIEEKEIQRVGQDINVIIKDFFTQRTNWLEESIRESL